MDLSKRPEGATHYSETGDRWYRMPSALGGDYDYISHLMNNWDAKKGPPMFNDLKPIVDWTTAPDNATHALTTGPKWRGDSDVAGRIDFVEFVDGEYVDDLYGEYDIGNYSWIVLEHRPEIEEAIKNMHDTSPSAHYDKYIYRVRIKPEDVERGYIDVKLDPYRVGKVCGVGGGALEQCLKKAMRGTDKGHSKKRVLEEIISAANRGLEMISEDESNEQSD